MYPITPSLLLRRSFSHLVPFSLVVGGSAVMIYLERGVGGFEFVGGGGGRGVDLLKCVLYLNFCLRLKSVMQH